ncbi:MAG TPA: hypothetical protein VGM68_02940 [Rhizomicrobium sp.]
MLRKYWFEIFHFTLWVLVGALLFLRQTIGLPLLLFAIVLSAVAFAINALHRQPKAALLILAAPVLTALIALPLQRSSAYNWVEFNLMKARYQAQVDRRMPQAGQPRLTAFRMDERSWQLVGSSWFKPANYVDGDYLLETLVYDESGEIAYPPQARSQSWLSRAQGRPHFNSILKPLTAGHRVQVTAMGGAWYWVEQVFQDSDD